MKTNKANTQHNPEKLATQGTQDEDKQNKHTTQSRETGNIGYTRRRQTIQKTQHNPEKLATQGTQDDDKQNKHTTQYVLDTTVCKKKPNNVNKT